MNPFNFQSMEDYPDRRYGSLDEISDIRYGSLDSRDSLNGCEIALKINLKAACIHGNLYVAKDINNTSPTNAADIRKHNNEILRFTCANGHTEVADWLFTTFKLNKSDVRVSNDFILVTAYSNMNVKMIDWAETRGEYTDKEIKDIRRRLYKRPCCFLQ